MFIDMAHMDDPITPAEWLALHFVGGRVKPEPSNALPGRAYRNPEQMTKFDREKKK